MKRLVYIFIPILAILLMSHNANALVTTLDMSGYEIVNSANSVKVNCRLANPQTEFYNVDICDSSSFNSDNVYLRGIESVNEWSFKRNDLVEFNILVYSPTNLSNLDGYVIGFLPNRGGFRTIEFNELSSGIFDNDTISISNGTGGTNFNGNVFYYVYHVVMRYLNTPDANFKVGLPLGNQNYFGWSGGALGFRLFNLNQYRLSGDGSIDQQNEINATHDAADEASSSGSSSEASAEAATSSLISVIGGFVSVVTSATPTNCLIDADLNHIDMGNIDLCANPVPSYIQIIGSIILICAVIPLAIILFNRFIGLFRSFQG